MQHENGSLHGNLALQLDPELLSSILAAGSTAPATPPRPAQRRTSGASGSVGAAARAGRTRAASVSASASASSSAAPAAPARPAIGHVGAGARPAAQPISMEGERKRQIRRELTLTRIRHLVLVLATVIAVSGLFGLVVWRQSRILEDNFANLAIERQIKRLDESSSQISEHLAVRTELAQIRNQAIQRLGLQVPARSQIVPVVIPNTDRVVFNDRVKSSPGDESYLMGLLFNLEGFFKTLDVVGSK